MYWSAKVPMFGTDVACALAFTPYETVARGLLEKAFI